MNAPVIALAANNGEVGGGEVMLLRLAEALRELGIDPLVVGPASPGTIIADARDQDLRTIALPAHDRRSYMGRLRAWHRDSAELPLWCNGLVPATATAGQGPRIVHLHALPVGPHRAALRAARLGAREVLVPSRWMARHVTGSRSLPNWTSHINRRLPSLRTGGPVRVGYLGRLTRAKGVDVLARAVTHLVERSGHDIQLVLAGENRFGAHGDDEAIRRALAPLGARVETRGWISRDALFAEVDLVVVPSAEPESFGLVAAEAMAAGVPVIVTDAGALPEVVGHTAAGIARAGDVEDLARVLDQALDLGEQGRADLADAARERWRSHYSPEAGARRLAALLTELRTRRTA